MRSSRQRRPPFDTVAIAAHQHVALLVADALREDLGERQEAPAGVHVDAVIFGDLGRFTDATLNAAFRMLIDGAELVALQHNRFYRTSDGLVPDVGEYAAALEWGTARQEWSSANRHGRSSPPRRPTSASAPRRLSCGR